MTVDILATAVFVGEEEMPSCVIFTSVHDAIQYVISTQESSCRLQMTARKCQSCHLTATRSNLKACISSLYEECFQDEWLQDIVGCVEYKLFSFLEPLIPNLRYLGPFGDPFQCGEQCFVDLLTNFFKNNEQLYINNNMFCCFINSFLKGNK